MHEMSLMCVQWFLHFQLNGWLVLGVLGLIFLHFEKKGIRFHWPKYQETFLVGSLVFTYALAVTWAEPSPLAFWVKGFSVILQFVAYAFLIKPLFGGLQKLPLVPIAKLLLQLAAISLLFKASFHMIIVFPSVAEISYSIRMYVIGFLHLVLLGVMSFGVLGLAVQNCWISNNRLSQIALGFLIAGFTLSELLLFGQGTLVWLGVGVLAHYQICLFLVSSLLPLGLALLMPQMFGAKMSLQKRKGPDEFKLIRPNFFDSRRLQIVSKSSQLLNN